MSIKDTCLSVREEMLEEIENLVEDTMVSMREGICNERIALRLVYYADKLKVK